VIPGFVTWFEGQVGPVPDGLQLEHAFSVAVCRIEWAVSQRARDPISCISNRGSASSRTATKSMLAHLGYNQAQTRIVQRLLAGSGSGWPGLIRLYTRGAPALTEQQSKYVTRQLREFRAASEPTTDAVARAG